MMSNATYLDYNATAPVRPEVADAIAEALAFCGNPSSVHKAGRLAHSKLETAREQVAALAGCSPSDVIFTSGGTEANSLALNGSRRTRLFVSTVEHPSVLNARDDAELIPVDGNGIVNLDWLDRALSSCGRDALVSVMAANNETGTLQPVSAVAEIAKNHGALFHCDAVQIPGKAHLDRLIKQPHIVSISAHKFGGPQGVGALIAAEEDVSLLSQLKGGGQERSKRAGTENLPGIVGFGLAAEMVKRDLGDVERLEALRDHLEARIAEVATDAVFASQGVPRLSNTTCFAVPGFSAETLVMALDLAGVMISAGSACSSGKVKVSHVLKGQGWSDTLATAAIRVSFGRTTTDNDIETFLKAWTDIYYRLGTSKKVEGAAA